MSLVAIQSSTAIGGTTHTSASNAAMLYLLTLGTRQSRDKMRRILNDVARQFGYADLTTADWGRLRSVDVLAVKAAMEQQDKAPATINLVLSALKGVVRQAWSIGQISDHDARVIEAIRGARGSRIGRRDGRALELAETSRLLQICGDNFKGARDALILALGVSCGLRRTEIASILLKKIDREGRTIRILGKGNKERIIYPSEHVWSLLEDWLEIRGKDGCRELFCTVRKAGHIDVTTPITGNTVYKVLRRLGLEAGIDGFTPHDLRRTFATRMFEAGADTNVVRQAMGHSSIATTQRYDKRSDGIVRKFASNIPI